MYYKKLLISLMLLIFGILLPVSLDAQSSNESNKGDALELFPADPCSLEFRGADVKNVLRSLALPYKVNLLVSERVSGKISASFNEVPIREVIRSVLKDANLGGVREGNILRIDTLEYIRKSKDETKSVTESTTKYMQVNYAFGGDLTALVAELTKRLSKDPTANISVIKRTNTLVITDLPEYVEKIEKMVTTLDKPSPQVAILAKVVSVSSNFANEFGIQWGGFKDNNIRGGNTLALQGDPGLGTALNGTNLSVNMPVNVKDLGVGGAVNLMIGEIGGEILEMQLSAMESASKGKVLANPKVITQDNQLAKMESTHKIFYPVTTYANGVTTTSYSSENVKITLEVTPHVIENRIFMDVTVEKGDLFRNSSGPPDTKNNLLNTKVLVDSGKTIVIGGLIEQTESDTEGGVPFFKDLPFVGWLFRHTAKSDDKKELLIFITPTVLQEGQDNV
ncbi:MAG: type IV pilus secretin PilQ [Candidatus Schekmanbacteria bacterium]|nr:type IV pilus secretin PilQ [Candidatus Schekmanbacteria bacterium]